MSSETIEQEVISASQDKSFISAYTSLPAKPETTVRFFERNGFNNSLYYAAYGVDAILAGKEHFRSLDAIKTITSQDLVLENVNLSNQAFVSFARHLLLVKQYRIEIYTEKGKRSGSHGWALERKASPGNLTDVEDLIFGHNDPNISNCVVGVKILESHYTKVVGLGIVDINDCVISLSEFEDNEHFSTLESVLVQLAPKEVVFCPAGLHEKDLKRLYQVFDRNSVLVTEIPNSDFDAKNIDQDLANLVRPVGGRAFSFTSHPDRLKSHAIAALCGSIRYLELLSDEKFTTRFRLEIFDIHLYVKMDAAACQALDIGTDESRTANKSTIIGAIDKCRTPQGRRLLAKYLKQPLKDKQTLEERLDLVEAFVEDTVLRQLLYDDFLRRIPDCQMLARKLMRKKATLQDQYKSYLFCVKLHLLQDALRNYEGDKQAALVTHFSQPLAELETEISNFCKEIQTTLDLDSAEKGVFIVRADVDTDLMEIWDQMSSLEEKMAEESYKVAKLLSLEAGKSLKLESNSQHGYFFRITLKDEPAIRNNSTYKVIDSSKGGIRFRNSALEGLSSGYAAKYEAYEEKQKTFVKELLERCGKYCYVFEALNTISAKLDVAISFAVSSVENSEPYVRPKLLDKGSGIITFTNLRHPCVELQTNATFIPNNIHFEKGSSSFYIVTGPNMGGKSTLLRSVGVATLLAQIGCFVPASDAVVSIVDAILARVGAGDALQKGISTFMAEMLESSFILKTASSDSLVLIDELGRGTSTYDGFGLCWAISEHLLKSIDCFCIVATHFHQLTELARASKSVRNVHFVAIPCETGLQMMHKLQPGSCDRSFGIHVGRVAEFPEHVLQEAQSMADQLEEISPTDEDDSSEGVKRRESERHAGYDYIDETMKEIIALGNRCNNEAEFSAGLNEIIAKVKKTELPYIEHLLSTMAGKKEK